MNTTIIISISIVLLIIFALYPYIESYAYVQHETPIALPSIDDGKSCMKYIQFMEQPINISYYSYPRFLNSKEACEDECIEGIWFDKERNGSSKCCKEACKNIKI